MRPETKFRIKTYLYYLVVEPWVSKFRFPNFRTLNLLLLIVALTLRWEIVLFITAPLALVFHLISEYKSGHFINWYKNYHYKKLREAEEKNVH